MKGKWMFCVMLALTVGLSVPCSAPEPEVLPTVLYIGQNANDDGLDREQIDCVDLDDMADVLAEREYQRVIFQIDGGESPEFQLDTYRMAAIRIIRTQPQAQIILQGIPGEENLNEEISRMAAKFRIDYAQPSDFRIYDD